MTPFAALGYRGQLARLRRLADAALTDYGVRPARLTALAHEENTTFRAETSAGERYALRIHRTSGSPFHPPRGPADVRSELAWLGALRRDTDLVVPEPVPTLAGDLVAVAATEGVPEPRVCALFRWVEGRFLDAGLTPRHLERVGAGTARLHEHALAWAPPAGFVRPRVGDLSDDAAAYAVGTTAEVFGQDAAAVVAAVIDAVRRARRDLGETPETFGLIHADLHQENYLFHRGTLRAIDFDDCGWGHLAYDLATTISEIRHKLDADALRAALLRGYRGVRPLPPHHERSLEVFLALRELLLTMWFLEQRHHPAFTDWADNARAGLKTLTAFVAA